MWPPNYILFFFFFVSIKQISKCITSESTIMFILKDNYREIVAAAFNPKNLIGIRIRVPESSSKLLNQIRINNNVHSLGNEFYTNVGLLIIIK